MSIHELGLTSIRWTKELSTNIFIKARNWFFEIEFLQRNRKKIALFLLIWLLSSIAFYLIFRGAVGRLKNDYYQRGISATRNLATNTGAFLLEKDVLALNVAIGEVSGNADLIFAAIVDHQDKILAHTDSDFLNKPFSPLKDTEHIGDFEKVTVEDGVLYNKKINSFSSEITYAGIKVGKAYLILSASELYNSMSKYKNLFILWIFFSFFMLTAILLTVDHASVARTLKRQKELEGITRLGPYILQKKLASGGMAELFIADYVREDNFRKTLAVKRVLPHLAEKPEFTEMFIREARLAALLQHPNIVQVFDFGKINDIYFIAMEYIHGKNLSEIMTNLRKGMAVDQAIFIISKICLGLEYSHSKKNDKSGKPLGIVHRDISPQNILISFTGEIKISDFGISKSRSEPSLTQPGVIKGKYSYLSPEEALGKPVDHQTDIFALGIVFYEILSGTRLYKFDNPADSLRSIPEKTIVPIKELRPDIPEGLNKIVMKCLEKDKKIRYQSANEIYRDLISLRKGLKIAYDDSNLSEFMQNLFKEDDNKATEKSNHDSNHSDFMRNLFKKEESKNIKKSKHINI
ncbi:MAG: serine/threonine protein kinase [bacterium]